MYRLSMNNNSSSNSGEIGGSAGVASSSPKKTSRDTNTSDDAAVVPPMSILARQDSTAERWRLVRELQLSSFNGQERRLDDQDQQDDDFRPFDNADGASVATYRSTKSWWRVLGRSNKVIDDDCNMSVRSTKTKSARGLALPRFRSKNSNKSRRRGNRTAGTMDRNRVMEDFFDVQSVASAPDPSLSRRAKPTPTTRFVRSSSAVLLEQASEEETKSVTSWRSLGGNVLFRHRNRNQCHPQVVETTTTRGPGFDQDVDKDITLASGLDRLPSRVEADIATAPREASLKDTPAQLKRSSSFLVRLFERKRGIGVKDNDDVVHVSTETVADKATRGGHLSDTCSEDSYDEEIMASSSSSIDVDADYLFGDARGDVCPADRWSPISAEVEPDAPKRPIRRANEGAISPPVRRPSGTGEEEAKEEIRADNDDDSVLSLLSGLLSTFVAESDTSPSPEESAKTVDKADSRTRARKGGLKTSFGLCSVRKSLSVSFGRIQIRRYERVVGDNPSCSSGPPISLGWGYLAAQEYEIEDYETSKPVKRTKKQFYLPASKRHDILVQEWMFTAEDIRRARREATYVQYCREKTAFAGKRAAAKEAAFLRQANRTPNKANPDSSDTSQPPSMRQRSSVDFVPSQQPAQSTSKQQDGSFFRGNSDAPISGSTSEAELQRARSQLLQGRRPTSLLFRQTSLPSRPKGSSLPGTPKQQTRVPSDFSHIQVTPPIVVEGISI